MMFRVNSRVLNKGEVKEVFFIGESHHETMSELHRDLVRDGSVCITRFDTRGPNEREIAMMSAGRRARFVIDEYEVILHKDGFTQISEPMEDVIGQDGEPIFLLNGDAA
jgi:transcription termination factor Rho